MGYNNVGSPVFFVNVLDFLFSTGLVPNLPVVNRTLPLVPQHPANWGIDSGVFKSSKINVANALNRKSFIAFINLNNIANFPDFDVFDINDSSSSVMYSLLENEYFNINFTTGIEGGFSVGLFDGQDTHSCQLVSSQGDISIGSAILGTYYTLNRAVNLSISQEIETEYAGSFNLPSDPNNANGEFADSDGEFTIQRYSKNPKWIYSLPSINNNNSLYYQEIQEKSSAWQIKDDTYDNSKSSGSRYGRRIWNLSFDYVDQDQLFPEISNVYDYGQSYDDNIIRGDNFFSSVVHKTLGFKLPFLFLADDNNKNQDQWAIAEIVGETYSCNKVANHVYNIKFTVREVW